MCTALPVLASVEARSQSEVSSSITQHFIFGDRMDLVLTTAARISDLQVPRVCFTCVVVIDTLYHAWLYMVRSG